MNENVPHHVVVVVVVDVLHIYIYIYIKAKSVLFVLFCDYVVVIYFV